MLEAVVGPIEIDPAVTHALQKGAVAASPGMKYKHYAPRAEVHIVKGSPAAYAEYVNAHAGNGVCALCFEEDVANLTTPAVTYGRRKDALSQAQQLFDALRQLDEQGATTVYAACPIPSGVGLAVYNRLLRAAAFRVINTIRVVGLTGPTGAGKSTVASAWHKHGVPIIDTDQLARRAVEPGTECLQQLVQAFSSAILQSDGTLNRAKLAEIAFADEDNAKKLNSITHPAILALTQQALEDAADSGHDIAVVDAPLLFEAAFDAICDEIVAVIAPYEQRKQRIMQRDGITDEVAQRRMDAQQKDAFYCREGVTVIHNDGDEDALIRAAEAVLSALISQEDVS
jgi:L-threonylcarbamoyladenylate synthase